MSKFTILGDRKTLSFIGKAISNYLKTTKGVRLILMRAVTVLLFLGLISAAGDVTVKSYRFLILRL